MEKLPDGISEAQFRHLLTLADKESNEGKFAKAQAVFSHLLTLFVKEQQEMPLVDEYQEVYEDGIEFINQLLLIGCL